MNNSVDDDKYDNIFSAVINKALKDLEDDDPTNNPERIHSNSTDSTPFRECEITPSNTDDESNTPNPPPLKKKRKRSKHAKQGHLKPKKLSNLMPKGKIKYKTTQEKLLEVQEKNNRGIWVQCCKSTCQKWRYLPTCKDPLLIPENWKCSMNKDPLRNDCEKPEENQGNQEYIFLKYAPGSVVWATVDGHPSWPAMVEEDPDIAEFCWHYNAESEPTHYHIVFFDTKVSRAWVKTTSIEPFESKKTFKKTIHRNRDYNHRMNVAVTKAVEALLLPVKERLKTFGFAHTYQGSWPPYTCDSSTDDEEDLLKKAEDQLQELEEMHSLIFPAATNSQSVVSSGEESTVQKSEKENVERIQSKENANAKNHKNIAPQAKDILKTKHGKPTKVIKPLSTETEHIPKMKTKKKDDEKTSIKQDNGTRLKLSFKPPVKPKLNSIANDTEDNIISPKCLEE